MSFKIGEPDITAGFNMWSVPFGVGPCL